MKMLVSLKLKKQILKNIESKRKSELDGLQIGLELTIVPQLQSAADELITIQEYNQQWRKSIKTRLIRQKRAVLKQQCVKRSVD